MKTIKVFLASSDELRDEREKFGNLIRQLDDIFLKQGIHIQLLVWEDMDPCYNNCRKQDEYNAWIRESQIFVALFYTRAGQYTLEELEVARGEHSRRQEPKLMIYCRNLKPDEVEESDLTKFKQTLEQQLGHLWGNYSTTDKLHHDFVMYFMRSTLGRSDALKVSNGQVVLDGLTIANMDNLPYAAGNEGYQDMKTRLKSLSAEIDQLWGALQQAPGVDYLKTLHQQKLNEYNTLQEKFTRHQQALFDTAKRISEMQLEKVSSELRQAVDAFENGHIEAANTILDGIEREADRHMEQLEQQRDLVHQDIKAFLVQTKTLMADVNIPIADRIKRVTALYAKADDWAQRSALDQTKYHGLLSDYSNFLRDYGLYAESLKVASRLVALSESLYGAEHPNTASSYNSFGNVYNKYGNYDEALKYYNKALAIREKVLGLEHSSTATSYNNIGVVYDNLGNYDEALKYHKKALAIYEKVLGLEHPDTASSYNNIGNVYDDLGNYDEALKYYFKDLAICEKVLGLEHPDTATSYNNIGNVYDNLGNYDEALKYYFKDLAICEKVLGLEHPDTAVSYNNIGIVYDSLGKYDDALEYHSKALAIREKVLGLEHPYTKRTKRNIEEVKKKMQ